MGVPVADQPARDARLDAAAARRGGSRHTGARLRVGLARRHVPVPGPVRVLVAAGAAARRTGLRPRLRLRLVAGHAGARPDRTARTVRRRRVVPRDPLDGHGDRGAHARPVPVRLPARPCGAGRAGRRHARRRPHAGAGAAARRAAGAAADGPAVARRRRGAGRHGDAHRLRDGAVLQRRDRLGGHLPGLERDVRPCGGHRTGLARPRLRHYDHRGGTGAARPGALPPAGRRRPGQGAGPAQRLAGLDGHRDLRGGRGRHVRDPGRAVAELVEHRDAARAGRSVGRAVSGVRDEQPADRRCRGPGLPRARLRWSSTPTGSAGTG